MSTKELIKRIEIIQAKVQTLWHNIESDSNLHCQTVLSELNALEKQIERGEVKPKKR